MLRRVFVPICLCLLSGKFVGAALAAEPLRFEAPERLTSDGLDKQRPTWSPDGKLLTYARHEVGGLHIRQYVLAREGSRVARRLTNRSEPEYDAVFSPDGKSLLMTMITLSGTQGNLDIASVGLENGTVKKIVGDSGKLSHQEWPSWAPDGKRFVYSSTHEGNQEIHVANIDGSNIIRLTQHNGVDAHPCWSRDGAWIYFATDRWGGMEIARIRPDAGGLTRLTKSPGLDDYPAVSHDGSRLAFVSNRAGQYDVFVASAEDGSEPMNVSNDPRRDHYPAWLPDGSGLSFLSNRGGTFEVYLARISRTDTTASTAKP